MYTSCDKIDGPYKEPPPPPAKKTVLIEKFTGHRCSGCPDGSREVENLKNTFIDEDSGKSLLISVAIHPGHMTGFTGITNTYYYDFTSPDGDVIAQDMNPNLLPQATVNRSVNEGGGRCWGKTEWDTKIRELLYEENGSPKLPNIDIQINNTLVEQELTIATTINVLNDLEGEYRLCLFIMEDSIIAPQLDGADTKEEYVHNHIYRCAVNGVYGESLETSLTSGLQIEQEHTITFDDSNNSDWNWNEIANCYIVGYVTGPFIGNENIAEIEQTHKQPVIGNE